MNQTIMTPISPEQMQTMISQAVQIGIKTYIDQLNQIKEEELLTVAQLADTLGVQPSTIKTYVRNRSIPYFRTGKILRFKKCEVEKALASSPKKSRKGV